ncbi:ABC transporter ATP-binding protein [Actinoalloteichus spitiensis]|uniref:ABC transporter ATP-binding protein n=1 Tax=Actinoalloteichus spitiensis TaxID=252394 RepID=UPI00037E0B10|nr:ABC transporter ATP-binding protein [Actinoalloteichus spitiensis]
MGNHHDTGRPVLSVRGLHVDYHLDPPVHAVRDLNLVLRRGEVLGIAGESGCGKSTLAYAVNRLLRPPAEVVAGSVVFHGADGHDTDVLALTGDALRSFRWRRIAMVFQGAMNALNPVLTIHTQLTDVLAAHEPGSRRRDRARRCAELLSLVGVHPDRARSYPHELSGGMRQRVMIAMALALNPDVLVMDEPTTALDVVVQRDILRELGRLRERFGFALVFITHDLSLLLEISDRIAIMYAGRVVEEGTATRLLTAPRHPYTTGLLGSFPSLTGPHQDLRGIPGQPPDLTQALAHCAFHDRCPHRRDVCAHQRPPLGPAPTTGDDPAPGGETHLVACHAWHPDRYGAPPPTPLRNGTFHPTHTAEGVDP